VFQHENEARHPNGRLSNTHKLNVIRSIWRAGATLTYEIDLLTPDAYEAFRREAELIGHYKRLHEGGPLTNRAAGGGSSAGPAPISKLRHTATLSGEPEDNPQRATLNRFVQAISPMASTAVKPLGQFVARPTVRFPSKVPSLTTRQAAALVASASANSVTMDGACQIPRRLDVEGVAGLIENGVSCDLLSSGSVTLLPAHRPEDEQFSLSAPQARAVVGLIGQRKCVDLGVLTPN
jgi:hypothetical protein